MYTDFRPDELLHHQLSQLLGNVLGGAAASAVKHASIDKGLDKVTYTLTFTVEREDDSFVVGTQGDWSHQGNTVLIGNR